MIALDAMGGDYAPYATIQGALRAARKGLAIKLFGDSTRLLAVLQDVDPGWRRFNISLHHCHEAIGMDEDPSSSVLKKKDSSLAQSILQVAQHNAQAAVSAGNSGAALIAGIVHFGKVPGILRPAIGSFLPTRTHPVFCLDLGANVDAKPEYLQQFAFMGDAYVRLFKDIEKPRIALLTNGTESCKGTKVIQQAHQLIAHSGLNFIGNCEPADIFNDVADVIVCEGFSGNIMLKSMEATVLVVKQWLKDEGNRSWWSRALSLLNTPMFVRLKKKIYKVQQGGALLLGVTKPLIIAHGASNAQAIEEALIFAHQVVKEKTQEKFNHSIQESLQSYGIQQNHISISQLN